MALLFLSMNHENVRHTESQKNYHKILRDKGSITAFEKSPN